MYTFLKITSYEYRMSVRRWSMWLAFGLLCVFYVYLSLQGETLAMPAQMSVADWWHDAARTTLQLNLFFPVVGGILASDRLWRDRHLRVTELLTSTPLRRWTYILGKYTGVVLSLLTPALLLSLALSAIFIALGAPLYYLPMGLATFVVMAIPAYAFITIFSLACPLIMPLRVYQVLFTGYWFWGNFLSPQAFPSISDTVLNAGGTYSLEGIFGVPLGTGYPTHTTADAVLNLLVLALCIAAAMLVLERYLAWQTQQA